MSHGPLNGVLRVSGSAVPDALAEARYRLDGVPRIWWVGPDSDAGTAEGLLSLGAGEFAEMPIMAVPIDQVAVAPVPAALYIAEATDLRELSRRTLRSPESAPTPSPQWSTGIWRSSVTAR